MHRCFLWFLVWVYAFPLLTILLDISWGWGGELDPCVFNAILTRTPHFYTLLWNPDYQTASDVCVALLVVGNGSMQVFCRKCRSWKVCIHCWSAYIYFFRNHWTTSYKDTGEEVSSKMIHCGWSEKGKLVREGGHSAQSSNILSLANFTVRVFSPACEPFSFSFFLNF